MMNTTAMYFPTLLAIMLLSVDISEAQEKPARKAYGGTGYFITGYSFHDFGELNKMLQGAGIPEADDRSLSFGGGGHAVIANFIIGGEGHGLIGSTSESDLFRVRHDGGYGFFNLGYLAVNSPIAKLYPMVGVGGGGVTVSITDKSDLPTSFAGLLNDPGHQSHLTTGGFMMNFTLGGNFFVLAETSDNATGGFLVGIRAGYTLAPGNQAWYMDELELSDGPDSGLSGPFVRITIGGGGITR